MTYPGGFYPGMSYPGDGYLGIAAKVEIAFVANPYGTLTWTDVTSRVTKIKTTSGRNYETGKNESSTVDLTLRNQDGVFNPLNPSSPYAPNVLPFRPVRITSTTTSAGGTVYPVWYGYVQRWPQSVMDQTSQYEVVHLTGVDAFKAVLGFVPGDPYDVKVRKDYGAEVSPGLASTAWDFWAFDGTAAPYASENTANNNAMTAPANTGAPTKTSPSPCRTAVVFNGSQGLYLSAAANAVGELWFNTTSLPTTPGSGAVISAAASAGSTAAITLAYLSGIPSARRFYMAGPNSSLASGLAITANYTNLMPSDNSASFDTSVADWASENTTNVTIAQSTVNPATGTGAMRASITAAAGATISQTTRSAVTAGDYYSASLAWAADSTADALTIGIRWYDSTGTLLSTISDTQAAATGGGTYQAGWKTVVQAPAGATTASIILTVSLTTGTTGTIDFDAISLYGAPTLAGMPSFGHMAYTPPSAGASTSLYACFGNTATTADVFIGPVPSVGFWHLAAWAPRYNTSAATIFTIDGVTQATTGISSTGNSFLGPQCLACMGYNGTLNSGVNYTGQLAGMWAMAPGAGLNTVNQAYSAQHYNYGTTAAGSPRTHDFPSEITSQRVNDVLTAIAFPPGMMSLETGLTTMSASGNVSGKTATALIESAAEAELGNVFVDPSGVVRFHNRSHRNNPTSVATFGGDGNIPYEGNVVIDFDDTYIYNDAQITQAGASPAYVYEIQDVTSQNTYGVRSLTSSIQVVNQSDVQGMGATLLARYKDAHARMSTLAFELRSKPSYLAQIMGLKIGDLITVNHQPLGGSLYTLQVFIDGISHTIDENQWLITFNTTPLYPNTTY